jgi:hypothetical protein
MKKRAHCSQSDLDRIRLNLRLGRRQRGLSLRGNLSQPAVCGLLYDAFTILLPGAAFWPLFFCFGFLASRFERFCSLLAIVSS